MTTIAQQQLLDTYAVLSAAVYDDVRKKANQINLPVGWNIAKDLSGSDLSMSNVQGLGFAATAYKNSNGDIVIAYQGTDLDTTLNAALDLSTDLFSGLGFGSSQIIKADLFYEQVKKDNLTSNITLTSN